jgi:hypothetical protein
LQVFCRIAGSVHRTFSKLPHPFILIHATALIPAASSLRTRPLPPRTNNDWSYTSGVIRYVGIEEFSRPENGWPGLEFAGATATCSKKTG